MKGKTHPSRQVCNLRNTLQSFSYSVGLSYFGEVETKGKSETSTEFLFNCRVEMLM